MTTRNRPTPFERFITYRFIFGKITQDTIREITKAIADLARPYCTPEYLWDFKFEVLLNEHDPHSFIVKPLNRGSGIILDMIGVPDLDGQVD